MSSILDALRKLESESPRAPSGLRWFKASSPSGKPGAARRRLAAAAVLSIFTLAGILAAVFLPPSQQAGYQFRPVPLVSLPRIRDQIEQAEVPMLQHPQPAGHGSPRVFE